MARPDPLGLGKIRRPLDRFGAFLTRALRDPAIDRAERLLQSEQTVSPSMRSLQRALAKLDAKERALVRRCVVDSVDAGIHDFLFALEVRDDFERDLEVRVDRKNVAALSDGLQGEPWGESGWFAKYSAHGQPPEKS